MRVLHAFNEPRSGGGSLAGTRATIATLRDHGVAVEVFMRNSRDLPDNQLGRFQAGANGFYARQAVKEFEATLERFVPDVVHVNELFPLVSPWILPACTRHDIPVVMTCDDYHLTCPVRNHFRGGEICLRCTGGREYWAVLKNCKDNLAESVTNALYNYMVRKRRLFADHVACFVAACEFTQQWLIDQAGVEADRTTLIPHVIDVPEEASDPVAGTYVAYAGRFVPEKGIDTLLEAAKLCDAPIRLSRNEHHFVTIDLPGEVDVVVTRGRDDLDAFYRGSRMLVVPSIWFETFGIVGAEAMSRGIPVVASRLGALANLVEDGVDGLLFEAGNAVDLAEKVSTLWEDPDLCRRLGQAARRKAAELWSSARHFELVRGLYENVSGKRATGA